MLLSLILETIEFKFLHQMDNSFMALEHGEYRQVLDFYKHES